jgi:hypothetical protein
MVLTQTTGTHGESQAMPKIKHITTACLSCRKKKIKCDGIRPKCSHCVLYAQECVFQPTADKRKIHCKDRLAALEAHSQHLEALLWENCIAVPVFNYGMPISESNDQSRAATAGEPSIRRRDPTYAAEPFLTSSESGVEDTKDPDLEANLDPLVDHLSGRMGSLQIADDGQLRFYGPTSNLTILQNGPLSINLSQCHSGRENWQQVLENSGLGQAVDPELEDHLVKLYFCWEDPSIHVVDEDLYRREKKRSRLEGCSSTIYSEVLTNAM